MSDKLGKSNPWYARFYVLLLLWVGVGFFTGWKQYSLSEVNSHINNFQIFRSSFGHFFQQMHLYPLYPKEYFDLYLYGPVFAVLMAPFAYLPLGWSVVLWNGLNAGMLFWAVWNLPMVRMHRVAILWIILNSTITALLNTQFHALCVAMILWSYILMQRGKLGWSAILIALGVFIKFYGIIGLAFFFFTKDRLRYAVYLVFGFAAVFAFPFLFGGVEYTWLCYQEWLEVLSHKNTLNVDIRNLRTDVNVPSDYGRWYFIQFMVFGSLALFICLGVFSAQKMGACGFSITHTRLGIDLYYVGQYRNRIAYINHGFSGRWDMVCIGGEIACSLGLVCVDTFDIELFAYRPIP
jgi:hypothetical protein